MKKAVFILVGIFLAIFISWFFIVRRGPVAYWNNITGGYYYTTSDDLYIFIEVLKMEEAKGGAFREPQFNYSWPSHLIYMVRITADGENQGHTIMDDGGFHNPNCITYALYQDTPIIFDCRKIYRLEDYHLVPGAINDLPQALREAVSGAQAHEKDDAGDFNRSQGVVTEGKLMQFSFSSNAQNIDWRGYRFVITSLSSRDFRELIIDADGLMTEPIRLNIPIDRIPFGPHRDPEPGFSAIQYSPGVFTNKSISP